MKLALAAVLVAALVAAPAARADVKLRVGAEAVLGAHDKDRGWTSLTDRFLPSANLMLGFTTPLDILSIDLEVSEQFLTNPGNRTDLSQASRQGTTLRPGITISAPIIPIYARAAIPIHIEPSPVQTYARVGAGLAFNFVAASVYIEGDADFPLFGGDRTTNINGIPTTASTDPFSQQIFSAGAGLQFKF
jgi:hypothetical protein